MGVRALLVFSLATLGCQPSTPSAAAVARAITDGTLDTTHDAVGKLKVAGYPGQSTATLVGKHTVLTAAHTILIGGDHTFELGGVSYKVIKALRHPDYDDEQSDLHDIGLLIIDGDPPQTPSIVSRQPPTVGLAVTLVGYGNTAFEANDGGVRRKAANQIKEVAPTIFSIAGTGNGTGNTCVGDSGGPAFGLVDGRERVVGVTSIGALPCGTLGIDTRVDSYQTWLEQASGGDLYVGQVEPIADAALPPPDAGLADAPLVARDKGGDGVGGPDQDAADGALPDPSADSSSGCAVAALPCDSGGLLLLLAALVGLATRRRFRFKPTVRGRR